MNTRTQNLDSYGDCIQELARLTHVSPETVAAIYASELAQFERARVTHYLPIIVTRRVLLELKALQTTH